jgi:hypothetical protein
MRVKSNATNLLVLIALTGGVLSGCGGERQAVKYTDKTYTATYERIPNKLEKKTTFKVSSDGKGHKVFIEDTRFQPVSNYRRIDDHTVGREYWLDAKEKLATWTLLKNGNNFTFDEDWLKSESWVGKLTSLPAKTIDGHNCVGYNFELRTKPPKSIEYWFEKNTDVLVSATGKTNGQPTWMIKLTSYRKEPLPADTFMIPEAYDLFEDPIGADKEDADNPFEGDHSGPPL